MHSVFRDPISGLTHLIGALFAIVALCILVVQAATYGGVWHMVSFSIFGATLFLMFASSALYHLLHAPDHIIVWLKRLDHMAIFLLIAGSYTPFCLIPLHGPVGWGLFSAVWALALAGVFLKLFWLSAPRWLSTVVYVSMGWLIVFAIEPAIDTIPAGALWWLLYGGLAYTVGAIVYATKKPDPWPRWFGFHEIWHLFVMAGAFCHFWAIAFYLADVKVA
ncbi:PAQR family membrane homeostasis protein TrhA [Thalassolituus oleivorans]|uniref:PAQR family membrane homeostasis protein TrhA n=1 Tax=Thalassolituus oleivorans TaxID=187493 RepID=UPI00042DC919|nr:hemolysin III family protein [Thalassolituus oleivorans]AHK16669.1 hemolysin [Thalassolituus oleivorans R6-15]MCA6126576.1 hemolysin [Thalassolituus oleivorans 4BN06-13]